MDLGPKIHLHNRIPITTPTTLTNITQPSLLSSTISSPTKHLSAVTANSSPTSKIMHLTSSLHLYYHNLQQQQSSRAACFMMSSLSPEQPQTKSSMSIFGGFDGKALGSLSSGPFGRVVIVGYCNEGTFVGLNGHAEFNKLLIKGAQYR